MDKFVDFLYQAGKLKDIPRRGWVLTGVKNPASIMDHSYRMALMAWVLGDKNKLNIERVLKMALVHDLCELYSQGSTPYERANILPKNKKDRSKVFDSWPRFSKSKKIKDFSKKHKKEKAALEKITQKLPLGLAKELLNLWYDYEKGTTEEARFVRQINRLETLMQAFEYSWDSKKRPYHSWWIGSEEHIDDPCLIQCMREIVNKFYPKMRKIKK